MTRDETKRILDRVSKLYMTQAKKLSGEEKKAILDTWTDTFEFDSYERVNEAINTYVKMGKPFFPQPSDIMNIIVAEENIPSGQTYSEADRLFNTLVNIADTLANGKERISIIDPGGPRWSDEYQKKIYMHAETVVSTTSFTQYDFKQLPYEIQEYVEDIEGLKAIWPEIESSREMARKRFKMALPEIQAEIARRNDKNSAENKARLEALFAKMNDRRRVR